MFGEGSPAGIFEEMHPLARPAVESHGSEGQLAEGRMTWMDPLREEGLGSRYR